MTSIKLAEKTTKIQIKGTLNVKNVLKSVLKKLDLLNGRGIYIIVVSTVYLLLILTVWFFPKAPSVPAVEPMNQAGSTINGV